MSGEKTGSSATTVALMDKRPLPQSLTGNRVSFLRAQLNTSTWMLLGALIQCAIVYGSNSKQVAILPALLYSSFLGLRTLLSISTYKPGQNGELLEKATADFSKDRLSDGTICVLMLGFKYDNPKGILARGVVTVGKFQSQMEEQLRQQSEEYGYLGSSAWLNGSDGGACNEILTLMYFRSREQVVKYAHSPMHRQAWVWWNENLHALGHIGISHEVYEAPYGNWEAIYANTKPSGLLATTFKAFNVETQKEEWTSPIVSARKGTKYFTHEGRTGRGTGAEHDKYADTGKAYGS